MAVLMPSARKWGLQGTMRQWEHREGAPDSVSGNQRGLPGGRDSKPDGQVGVSQTKQGV